MKTSLLILGAWLLFGSQTQAQTTSISILSGEEWKYTIPSTNPAASWKTNLSPAYNDPNTPWFVGRSPLGFGGQGSPATLIADENGTCLDQCASTLASTCRTSCGSLAITTYFRKTFDLANKAGSTFTMRFQRDDGIVIYINGEEVIRSNMAGVKNDPVGFATLANAYPPDANEKDWVTVDPATTNFASYLKDGQNLIAVEIHQYSATSSDLRFNLELKQTSATPITLERGPYLQRYSDDENLAIPANKRTMTIRWSTNVAAGGQVIYTKKTPPGTPPASTTTITSSAPQTPYSWSVSTPASRTITLYDVSVTLNNLEPNTPYSYTIQSGSMKHGDATHYFKTAPLLGSTQKTRMWVLGDFGKQPTGPTRTPNPEQINVRNAFNNHVKNNVVYTDDEKAKGTDKYIDLWLWLGDNAYDYGNPNEFQWSVFDVYGSQFNVDNTNPLQVMKQTPIVATPGNHDYGKGDLARRTNHSLNHYYSVVGNKTAGETAGEHSGKEEYYSFDHGNIHFVSLDTYGFETSQTTEIFPTGSPQLAWLKRDLEAARGNSNIKWIIVFFHHPPYTMGSYNSDTENELKNIRAKLVKDVMDFYKVDLVLAGHSHTYERSRPLNGHDGTSSEFSPTLNNAPESQNGLSSGKFDGSANSCFYYRSAGDPKKYTVYVTNGAGGNVGGTQPGTGTYPHKAMQVSHNVSGSMYIEVEGDRLDAKFIDENQVVKDQFTIIKDTKSFNLPQTDGQTRRAVCECTDAEGWTHYTDLKANLLLSIKKNGNNIGKAWDSDFDLKLQGASGVTSVSAVYPTNYVKSPLTVMNRYWTLKTRGLSSSTPVSIRHYWDNEDYNQLKYTTGARVGLQDAEVITINNSTATNYTVNPTGGSHNAIPKASAYNQTGAWVYRFNAAATTSTWDHGNLKGRFPHFPYSEFTVGWLTNTGGTVGGRINPGSATNAGGRLMVADGLAGETGVTVYPNPTLDGKVYFAPALPYQSFQLTDLQGKVLKRADEAGSLTQLDLTGLPPGLYVLVSQGESGVSRFKLIRN